MLKVFVGCASDGEDAESLAVLEYTARKHTSQPIEIVWMKQAKDGFWSGWNTSKWATPFSGFRWGIPAFCKFKGRALYVDSDMIVMSDLSDLWDTSLGPGKVVAAKGTWRFCVSLWDCAAAQKHFPEIHGLRSHAGSHSMMGAYFRQNRHLIQPFDPAWNYCDNEDFGPIEGAKILHYTDMSCQPHLRHALPRLAKDGRKHWFNGRVRAHPRPEIQDLFDALLQEAREAGFHPEDYVPAKLFGPYAKRDLTHYRGRT